jgi:hypothetical protein
MAWSSALWTVGPTATLAGDGPLFLLRMPPSLLEIMTKLSVMMPADLVHDGWLDTIRECESLLDERDYYLVCRSCSTYVTE